MRQTGGGAAIGIALALLAMPGHAWAAPRPAIAITVDDLPAHGPLPPGQTRPAVIRALTAAFKAAGVPAFGFFNAGFGRTEPGYDAAIAAWRDAGLRLGNHTHDHPNLDQIGATAFLADLDRNEAPLAGAAPRGSDWHWFRYPFLSEGKDPVARDAVRAGLKARGYRVAAVTMSFDDFKWQAPYAACRAANDKAAIAALEKSFLADARAAALDARAAARAQTAGDVPYVLLLHAGAMDAAMMPRLLRLYRALGFRFVTLEAAEADPFYAAATDLSRPGPTRTLPRAALAGPSRTCTP